MPPKAPTLLATLSLSFSLMGSPFLSSMVPPFQATIILELNSTGRAVVARPAEVPSFGIAPYEHSL